MHQIINKMYIIVIIQYVFAFIQEPSTLYQYLEGEMVQADWGFGYGLWMRYAPLMKIGQVGSVLQNQSNNSLLTYVKDGDTQKLQMVVQLKQDYENLIMKFEAFVYSNSETHHIQHEVDPMNFEGLWYLFYFQCNPDEQRCQFVFSDFNINYTIYEISEQYPFQQSNNLQIIIGGGLNQDSHLLAQFPGNIMYETFKQFWFEDIDVGYLFNGADLFDSCLTMAQTIDDILFSQDSSIKFDQSSLTVNGYTIMAWYKLIQVQSTASDVNIIRVSQNGQEDFVNHIGGNAFGYSLSWDLLQIYAQLTTYSYKFPMINLDMSQGDPFSINQIFNINQDLNQWAFLQFSYSLRSYKMLFQVQYPNNKISYINQNARQFSRAVSTVYIGNNYFYSSQQQGIVKNFKFDFCEGLDDLQENQCHITCETCLGPYDYQCLSCQLDSLRVYQNQTNTCTCSLGNVDSGDWQCFGQDSELVILQQQRQDCVWGQFIYNNKCYQCPNQSSSEISCIECLTNPQSWIYDPYCYTNYQQQIKGSNQVYFQSLESRKQYFMMQSEQLIKVLNVARICDNNESDCTQYRIYHLDKLTFVQCMESSNMFEGQCVECYDPNCQECFPFYLKYPCSECKQYYRFDPTTLMCVFKYQITYGGRKCPIYCDSLCSFCSCQTKNCKNCITGYYVGFDYNCHQCSIVNCLKCFEFNQYDVNQNTLNYRFESIDQSLVQAGCVECGEGYIYDFVLQICKIQQQVAPQKGQHFSGISPQISDCTGLITNCQRCIQSHGRITCVKCVDGYFYQDSIGTCTLCDLSDTVACAYTGYFDDDYLMENYQGFYVAFRSDGQIYTSQSWARQALTPTKCKDGYSIRDSACQKYCDSNCKTCIYNCICLECYPQNGLPIFTLINNQCVQCPYLCEVCYSRTPEQIKFINNRFIYTEENKFLTYACIKAATGYSIDNQLQVVKYFDNYVDQGNLQIVKNIIQTCILDDSLYYYEQNYHIIESQELIDFLNIRQSYSFTYNITMAANLEYGAFCPFNGFTQDSILKKQVFILTKLIFKIYGQDGLLVSSYQSDLIRCIQKIQTSIQQINTNFNNQIVNVQLILLNQQELFAKNMTFSNFGNSSIVPDIQVQNATFIQLEGVTFDQYYGENTIFMNLEQENSLIINMTNITFNNCTFSNFTLFRTNSYLRNLNVYINGLTFINCTLINFQLIEYSIYTNNNGQINNIFVQFCNFFNMSLINQITNGPLQLSQIYIYQSNLTSSNVISLNSNSMISQLIIQQCNLISSKIVSLNTFTTIGEVNLTMSNISIQNITYDSSRLIELDSYNFFELNLILENIRLKYNQFQNTSINSFQGFWVIRCQNLQISDAQIVRKYLSNIEFILVNVSNIQISNISFENEGEIQFSSALIAVDQFQTIQLENIIISELHVIDSPIIFITSESQIQLFVIQQESIYIKNITFIQNTLKKTIEGKFESMIYIISNHYQQINIQEIRFYHNTIIEQTQNNQIDSSGLLFISSLSANLMLLDILSFNDSILNTTNSLFFIQAKTVELGWLDAQMVNFQGQVQSSVGLLIISSNIINLQNVQINQVKSQIVGCMKLQTAQQGAINIENLTIQGIYTFNVNPFAIDESIIQIDQQISQLQLNITNVIIKSCVLGSGGFLKINSQRMLNQINLSNITLINVYSFKCQFVCMTLNSLIQYENSLDINDAALINYNGYEMDLFIDNKINVYVQNLESLLNLNNSIIQVSYANTTISNLFISGQFYSGFLMLTDMQNVVLNNVNLVNSNIISSCPLQFTLNNKNNSKIIFTNVIIMNITVNSNFNRRLLEQQSIYEYKFISMSLFQNNQQFQAQNFMIQQINCISCSNGLFRINLDQVQNNKLNFVNFIFNNNQCGIYGCIFISNTYMNQLNDLNIVNSFLIDNQANNGIIQIANLSISLNNISFIKNKVNNNGSAITYESNQTSWNNIQLIENTGVQSGGLITQSTDFLNLDKSQITFLFNTAKQQSENLMCQATNLALVFQNIKFQHISIKQDNIIINEPLIKGQNYLEFPIIDDKLSSYQVYDLENEEYQSSNLLYDLYPTNKFMEILSQYQNSTCTLNTTDYDLNITYSQNIQLIEGSTFDTIYFRSNPYTNQLLAIISIECDFIKNYKYAFQAKFLPCQLGEYYFNQTCKKCDQFQGFYSVSFNAISCSKADTSLILNNTSNNLQLQQFYWRPTRLSPYIEYCHQNIMNCLGGWQTGDNSCLIGHLGALCEQCDIYNTRGAGQFTQKYGVICANCGQAPEIEMITIIGTLIWTLISVFVTVRSIIQSNEKLKHLKKVNRKFFQILFRQDQDQSSTLLKMAIYDMQIIQAIYTFQINFQFNMSSFNDFFSYPVESVTYNIECHLSQISEIPIIYLRIIWVLLISMFTIIMFIMIYLTFLVIKKQRYESVVIYTSLLYMYVYIQPYIIRSIIK